VAVDVAHRADPHTSATRVTAALGFSIHTGRAVCVAARLDSAGIIIVGRETISLLPVDESVPRFAYHDAAKLGNIAAAEELVLRAEWGTRERATQMLGAFVDGLGEMDTAVRCAGVVVSSMPATRPEGLAAILRAHAKIHASEGALYRDAVVAACTARGIRTTFVTRRVLWDAAAAATLRTAARMQADIDALRASVGAPWTADEKSACAAALVAAAA
jgi:hypothetical protein